MGSNGTFNFTWTASKFKNSVKSYFKSSNGTFNFTWTASALYSICGESARCGSNGTFNFTWTASISHYKPTM